MRLRKLKRLKLFYMDDLHISDEDSATIEFRDSSMTPEEELGKTEVAVVMKKEISRIPPLLREVFVLRELRELPMEAVAAKLGISLAAAKSRLLRARLELRSR